MTLPELIQIASRAYPDDAVSRSYHGEKVGDTLADFIQSEISETYDQNDSDLRQFAIAVWKIEAAIGNLEVVAKALRDEHFNLWAEEQSK